MVLLVGLAGLLAVAVVRPIGMVADGAVATFAAVVVGYGGFRLRELSRKAETQLALAEEGRRRAELESAGQRTAIDAFADGLEVAIVICDERAHVIYANRRACEMFGTLDPVGRALLAMTLSPELEAIVEESTRVGAPVESEISFRPGDRVALAKAWAPDEASGRTFLSLIEISDLRRLDRVRNDFVANVSHELRTPMTIIRAYAETLLEDEDPELKDRYMQKIIAEVDRLTSISHDLLVLSTAESGIVGIGACDLAEIVRNTVSGLEKQAAEKELELIYEGPESLTIGADPSQITQVAINLVENAVKYSREGSILVTLEQQDGTAQLCVKDAGIGIGSEHIERIFERFYRVDRGRSRREGGVGGTGLGLAIVKHIVEAHGGTISVESVLNVGSTFCVRLPLGPATA